MNKKIFIILPYKESLKPSLAGAVSIYANDTTNLSKYNKKIKIISSDNNPKKRLFKNKNYILDFCKKYHQNKIDIIEIHNRPEYLPHIKEYFPKTKIILYFHNNPLTMRLSSSINEREFIINNTDKIIFISTWIQQKFYSGLKDVDISKSDIVYHGVNKIQNINLNTKEKNILFVGKLNKAKGYDIFCKAASMFKRYNPKWNFIAIGDELRKNIFPKHNSVKELGYLNYKKVLEYYQKSEIAIGNSVWDEPLGRIAIEASSRKCLAIISNKAGLSESKKIAHVLKNNSALEIFNYLKKITLDNKLRRKKQNIFYKNNNFDIKVFSRKLDSIRDNFLFKTIQNKNTKNKKILHIANFNESSNGRLFYSFANKMNNGFIKNNHIVQTISDRNYLKLNKSIFNPLSNKDTFNQKVIDTLKNFSPDLLLIGHVFNLKKTVFDYCKTNNIKICSWYIDSLSNEFLKDEQRKKFFKNLQNVDKCFVTSSPKIFKSHKYFNKLQFIPNPVDSSIENLKNYKNNTLNIDIFSAISHGQNRGVLKKGKNDDREKLINDLYKSMPEIKFALFGMNTFEPVWGANYYYYLSKSKMALNISRGKYQRLYSSDRISSLIGNGLLVFIDVNTEFKKLFTDKEVIFYENKQDLINKIKYYSSNSRLRKKTAELGHKKYHKFMNNKIIANYILKCSDLIKFKNPYWHNLN